MQQSRFSPPLMNNLSPASPPISATLLSKGKHTIGHETNLCRAPIWHTRSHSTDDDTVVSPVLFGHHFRKVEGHCLTTTDQRLFAQLTTTSVRPGRPDSLEVPFSLGDAATTMGHGVLGGRQRSLIRSLLGRLRSVIFEFAMRHPDVNQTKRRDSITKRPEALIQAWHQAYRSHLPSPRQRSVFMELLSRRSVEWSVASLDEAPDDDDSFGYVLELDRTLSARGLHAATVPRHAGNGSSSGNRQPGVVHL